MTPEIVIAHPPNFLQIHARFPFAHNYGTIFAYGDKIYNPHGVNMSPELMAHELVHCKRQLEFGVEAWWEKYLTDHRFLYWEELLAHRAEYQSLCQQYPAGNKRKMLFHTAKKLSAKLYGPVCTYKQAVEDIRYRNAPGN